MTERKLVIGIIFVIVWVIIIGGIWARYNTQGILELQGRADDTLMVVHEIPFSDTLQVQVLVRVLYDGTIVEIIDADGKVVSRGETRDRRNPIELMLDQIGGSGLRSSAVVTANTPDSGIWRVRITSPEPYRHFSYHLKVSATSPIVLETRVLQLRTDDLDYYYQVEAWLRNGNETICDAEITAVINNWSETDRPTPLEKIYNCHFVGQVGPVTWRDNGFSLMATDGLIRRQTFFPR